MTTNDKAKAKLAPAKEWSNRPIDTWNTTTFHAYIIDEHKRLFGIDYAPMGGRYAMEQGVIGGLIGTGGKNPKPRTASNADVKAFIDVTFAGYRPTAQYPGTSFGFMWTYRKTDWQRIQAESIAKARRKQAVEESDNNDWDEVSEWL